MPLQSGTRIGPYEIVERLGAGGMGEVYRARDAKLQRDVAIKILPDGTLDADRLARFEREARVLAALNHPNIGAIYGFEQTGQVHGLVLELVEGPTLADRLRSGPIPLGETLRIARDIADALDAAHSKGIVHRDLKPANIKDTVLPLMIARRVPSRYSARGRKMTADEAEAPHVRRRARRLSAERMLSRQRCAVLNGHKMRTPIQCDTHEWRPRGQVDSVKRR